MHAVESKLLSAIPGITHAFGTAAEPIDPRRLPAWEATKPVWKQVHGTALARVESAGQSCGEVDSLWSDASGQWIGVATADCVPMLIAERSGRAVAAVHAGWRGTLARAVKPVIFALDRAGYPAADLVAVIGPHIRPCCFEVGSEVVEEFVNAFPQIAEEQLNPRHRHLDLAVVNEALLRGFGVEQVEVLDLCTKCGRDADGSPAFQSYRRDGGGTRQWSIIARTASSSG